MSEFPFVLPDDVRPQLTSDVMENISDPDEIEDERVPLATEAHARRNDPVTSHAAARSVDLRDNQRAVLECLRNLGSGTDEEIAKAYVSDLLKYNWKPQSVSGLRTRRHELVEAGYVVDSGTTVKLPSGRDSIVWRITDAGVRQVPQDAT